MNYDVSILCWYRFRLGNTCQFNSNIFSLEAFNKAWFCQPQSHHYGGHQIKTDGKQTCFPVCIFLGDQLDTHDGVLCCAAVWKSIRHYQQNSTDNARPSCLLETDDWKYLCFFQKKEKKIHQLIHMHRFNRNHLLFCRDGKCSDSMSF